MLFDHPSPNPVFREATVRVRVLIAATVLLTGCGGTKPPEILRVCPDWPATPRSSRSFTFALTESVRPGHAPLPTNDSEAILFGLAYPGLVLTDCEGGILPWAAASWDWSPSDSAWVFALDPGVTFADGVPLLWAARLQGTPLPDRVAGSDLVWLLAERAAQEPSTALRCRAR